MAKALSRRNVGAPGDHPLLITPLVGKSARFGLTVRLVYGQQLADQMKYGKTCSL